MYKNYMDKESGQGKVLKLSITKYLATEKLYKHRDAVSMSTRPTTYGKLKWWKQPANKTKKQVPYKKIKRKQKFRNSESLIIKPHQDISKPVLLPVLLTITYVS